MWFPELDQSPLGDLEKKKKVTENPPQYGKVVVLDRQKQQLGWDWRDIALWESQNIHKVLGSGM